MRKHAEFALETHKSDRTLQPDHHSASTLKCSLNNEVNRSGESQVLGFAHLLKMLGKVRSLRVNKSSYQSHFTHFTDQASRKPTD